MTGYKHAEVIAQYAEEAKTNAEPWLRIQLRMNGTTEWRNAKVPPAFVENYEYRMRPKPTICIEGLRLPAPETTAPPHNTKFWVVNPFSPDEHSTGVFEDRWLGTTGDRIRLKRGVVYLNRTDAECVAAALRAIMKQEPTIAS